MFSRLLELQSSRELNNSRWKCQRRVVITRCADVPVLIGDCEVGMVQEIESLCSQLQLHSFGQPDRLEQRSVDVEIARPIKRVAD
jgi:hypothetical protein